MPRFPSELSFVSYLKYAVRGKSGTSIRSKTVTYAIKRDGAYGDTQIIDYTADRMAKDLGHHPQLNRVFGSDVTLVPAPRSSPLFEGALWPPLRICQALEARDLAQHVLPCLTRTRPVQRASTAPAGERPLPPEHYDSLQVSPPDLLRRPTRITLVDDVITRGSTFVGAVPKLQEAYPSVPIMCFALVRTISSGDVDGLVEPVAGTVTYERGRLHREP